MVLVTEQLPRNDFYTIHFSIFIDGNLTVYIYIYIYIKYVLYVDVVIDFLIIFYEKKLSNFTLPLFVAP